MTRDHERQIQPIHCNGEAPMGLGMLSGQLQVAVGGSERAGRSHWASIFAARITSRQRPISLASKACSCSGEPA